MTLLSPSTETMASTTTPFYVGINQGSLRLKRGRCSTGVVAGEGMKKLRTGLEEAQVVRFPYSTFVVPTINSQPLTLDTLNC